MGQERKTGKTKAFDRFSGGAYVEAAFILYTANHTQPRKDRPKMFASLARAVFGTSNDRALKNFARQVAAINALEPDMVALDDAALAGKTAAFRARLGEGETLDDLLPEAFAVVREGAKRALGLRHFDVQLIGGMVLHSGRIAEMKTGEGKTLVATLAVYLNALASTGVHVVTVNDYLASRDAEWMGRLYGFLGMTTGIIVNGLDDEQRRAAYASDITYGTNNEFGFDYLRDNMKYRLEDMVQRPFAYAIVDEVDSILIDEARTPLIISGPSDEPTDMYAKVDIVVAELVKRGASETGEPLFDKDEKARTAVLTDLGSETVEQMLRDFGLLTEGNLYDIFNISLIHHVQQSLRARVLYTRDVDYIVRDGKVIIIDEFTGRMLDGRRYSDGLHQALEAKEKVTVEKENQTLASITFQNYFRLYPKLAGMTGTAMTEADEFEQIYKLQVVEIPTNVKVTRKDADDEVYRTAAEKYEAVAALIAECQERGQPVLVGTTSIEKSEIISNLLNKKKVPHSVLNARFHEQEAKIVAQAGAPGAITIATNMAGRGTDIKLGGNLEMRVKLEPETDPEAIRAEIAINHDKVKESGGLFVIGTERHESRRIDNQLRGRAGRQGDPGASRFFLSLEDDLMRIFGSDRMGGMLQRLGLQEGEAIIHPWINKALEKAQKKVETRNFDTRKNVLKYDDVMNDQRKEIYAQRREFMSSDTVSTVVAEMREDVIDALVTLRIPAKAFAEQWQSAELAADVKKLLALDLPVVDWAAEEGIDETGIRERVIAAAEAAAAEKARKFGPDLMKFIEKSVLLQTLDQVWKEHLLTLDQLRQGIWLRGIGQRDPLNEYKREAFALFNALLDELKERVTNVLSHVVVNQDPQQPAVPPPPPPLPPMIASHAAPEQLVGSSDLALAERPAPIQMQPYRAEDVDPNRAETWGATPRNAACPCGSGKKYKYCHGRV
jgi:preprotein translocase subunit SecA